MSENEYPSVEIEIGNALGIEATILHTKFRETPWGMSHNMLIEVDTGVGRYKLYGPVPKALEGSLGPEPGRRITMICNVKASDNDPCFGFFARPRSAFFI